MIANILAIIFLMKLSSKTHLNAPSNVVTIDVDESLEENCKEPQDEAA